jgi:hypothetical protein
MIALAAVGGKRLLGHWLRCGQPQPQSDRALNDRDLGRAERTEAPNQLGVWDCDDVLCIEDGRTQKRDKSGRLEP